MSSDSSLPELRKVDVAGYMGALVGLVFVVDYGFRVVDSGLSPETLGGLTLGLCGVGGAIHASRNPREASQREPAPTYLLVLAAFQTVVFLVLLWLRLSKL